jgi:hypothetical protein
MAPLHRVSDDISGLAKSMASSKAQSH